ncbi:prolactin-releasing peptide [Eublepharis macularius]|uniref:Prolactin-releasing peptide n=1 Tax=Eublepharis macularius TaxID=481883 RepID=A0AA97K373_EUBMA|nr:prolactin-releasing peptide [Eublepharis macularius]
MELPGACLLCLLLLGLVLPYAESRIFERSMEIRNPDIDPSWYTGRGIRPVGRFGRRRAASESIQKLSYGHRQACFPIEESNDSAQDE